MDIALLHLLNQTAHSPIADAFMAALTLGGTKLLVLVGLIPFLRGRRRLSVALLTATAIALALTFVFYALALRPRPVDVQILLPTPLWPSFPSGHTAGAFALAAVLCLVYRRWWQRAVVLSGAALMGISRIYLGHHYPTDVLAGAVLGAAVGAAVYGMILAPTSRGRSGLGWLVWPQIAIAILVTMMAYLDLTPVGLMEWPWADKVLHFVLFGAVAFGLNLWLAGRKWQLFRVSLPIAIVLPLLVALVDEGFQAWSPLRTADIIDLTADLLGLVLFWWLSRAFFAGAPKLS